MTPSAALYGFAGWLISKHGPNMFPSKDAAIKFGELLEEWMIHNNLPIPEQGFSKTYSHPESKVD